MAGQKTITRSDPNPPPAPPIPPNPYLIVTGDGDPSPNDDYYYRGHSADHDWYANLDLTWFIWFDEVGAHWFLTDRWGDLGGYAWICDEATPQGTYFPIESVTGNPEATLWTP